MMTSDVALLDELVESVCSMNCALMDHEGGANLLRAREILSKHPNCESQTLVAAAVCGNENAVQSFIDSDPACVNQKQGPRQWEPLLYVCFSRFLRGNLNAERARQVLNCARLILEAGADPNVFFMLGEEKETALYGAVGVCNHVGLTTLLLNAGADPNDDDGSYHVAEFEDTRCIKALFDHGMNEKLKATVLLRKLDFDHYEGVEQILDYGADVNAMGIWGKTPLHQAIMRGRDLSIIQLLIDRGADVNACRNDGKSAIYLASRYGRQDVADLLMSRGAERTMDMRDAVVASLALGRLEAAQELADSSGLGLDDFEDYDRSAIVDSARNGNLDGVRAMLEFGFDVAIQDGQGFSALHWATWYGHQELTRFLLDHGAPLELKNNYGGTVIDSAVWGYAHSDGNDVHAETILPMLASAGADLSAISPFPSGNAKVDRIVTQLVREHS